jgi:hypothetical protein
MARLNEPPIVPAPPVETNDAELIAGAQVSSSDGRRTLLMGNLVKRKFLRQNRELAKYVLSSEISLVG